MQLIKNYFLLCLVFGIAFFYSCQEAPAEEAISQYPDTEIPLGTENPEAKAEFVSAVEEFDMGDTRIARAGFEKALELDPDFVSAQIFRAWTSNSAKDWAENRGKALAMRDKANEAEAILLDAMKAGMDDDDDLEFELANKLVELYPNSARAHENLAFEYMGRNEDEKARERLAKALEVNPNYHSAKQNLGLSYLNQSPKDFKKAETIIAELAEALPENSNVQYHLGDCFRAQNDLSKALTYYLRSAELDKTNQVSLMKAGHANTFLGNFEEARQNYKDARQRSEYGTGGMNWEAYTHIYEGDHQKAVDDLNEKFSSIDGIDMPDGNKTNLKMNLLFNIAFIARHNENVEQLKDAFERMKPVSNQIAADLGTTSAANGQAENMLEWEATILALEGQFEEAIAKVEESKSLIANVDAPNQLNGYNRVMGLINEKQGNLDDAIEYYGKLNVDNVYDKYMLAKTHELAGNSEKANNLYAELVDFNFNNIGYALTRNELKEKTANP